MARIRPLSSAEKQRPLRGDSRLAWTVVRMISLNSLASFTQEVARTRPAQGAAGQGIPPVQQAQARAQDAQPQRALEAVPPQPNRPLPRGSLLDLRV